MEKYIEHHNNNEFVVNYGYYTEKIIQKHIKSFGEDRTYEVKEAMTKVFVDSQKQLQTENHNLLLVGKVQSGKTASLEMLSAISFDNGYNLIIIYGGYDNTLLEQTTNRFTETFDCGSNEDIYEGRDPEIFSTDDNAEKSVNDDKLDAVFDDLAEVEKPVFIISMKRPVALGKVNKFLSNLDHSKYRALIIDDEGDQASLNTAKDKKNDGSATYREICCMKDTLGEPLYLSVTATPHANIFLDAYSRLKPKTIRLIEPGDYYCGAARYHLSDGSNIVLINVDDFEEKLDDDRLPPSLRRAIHHFIISSAILLNRGIKESDMIIHGYRTREKHHGIYDCVEAYLKSLDFRTNKENRNNLDFRDCMREFEETYNDNELFSSSVRDDYAFDSLIDNICVVISRTRLVMLNSDGKDTRTNLKLKRYKIFIGGDLLQRGVTFKLLTTFFTRWASDGGNMDTNLQRARWFGYREEYIDLCRIFTTEEISHEFTVLSEIEEDLWDQFYQVQNGDRSIDEIIIQADKTKQKPAGKNRTDYKKISFKQPWVKQSIGIFDNIQLEENNRIVNEFVRTHSWSPTNIGQIHPIDGEVNEYTSKYSFVSGSSIQELLESLSNVFERQPFHITNKTFLSTLFKSDEKYPIILMPHFDDSGRERSFYPETKKILVLQQGANSTVEEKLKYKGDRYVIVDENKINIQIHKIVPRLKDGKKIPLVDKTQYMFAFYLPNGDEVANVFFVRGDNVE